MEKQPPPNKLKAQISGYIRDFLAKNVELAQGVQQTVEEGNFDPTDVSVALQLSEGISRTIREVVESGIEIVIFPNNQSPEGQQRDSSAGSNISLLVRGTEEGKDAPRTFSELLTQKIKTALPEKEEFAPKDLQVFTSGLWGAKNIIKLYPGLKFSKDETSKILQQVLTTPSASLENHETYDKSALLRSFNDLRGHDLNDWASEIKHNWQITPEVDFQTAMQIRGLMMFKKLNLPPKPSS